MKRFDVVIIGAGSVGVPLSWQLAEKGLSVAVVDEEASWGRGQNRAAIGGVRATHSDAAKIRICLESIEIFSTLQSQHGFDVEWRPGGYLYVAYDAETEGQFRSLLEKQKAAGLNIDWVSPDTVARMAPGILMDKLRGGTFSPEDGYASPLMAGAPSTAWRLRRASPFSSIRASKGSARKGTGSPRFRWAMRNLPRASL